MAMRDGNTAKERKPYLRYQCFVCSAMCASAHKTCAVRCAGAGGHVKQYVRVTQYVKDPLVVQFSIISIIGGSFNAHLYL
jgi:hypothetical protein